MECKFTISSHGILITKMSHRARLIVHMFAAKLAVFDVRRVGYDYVRTLLKVYAARTVDLSEYVFNRNQLDELLVEFHRGGVDKTRIEIEYVGDYIAAPLNVSMPADFVPREKQVPLINFILGPGVIKAILLQTGQGKTKTALAAAALFNERLIIVVPAKFVEQWIDEVVTNYSLKTKELVVCKGYSKLKDLLQGTHNGTIQDYKVCIITSTSMMDYFKHWEQTKFIGLPEWLPAPHRFYQVLRAGIRIIDEVHLFFHLNFKMDLYTHLHKTIYLSATLESADAFVRKVYRIAYPLNCRMDGGAYIRYVNCTAVEYKLAFHDRAKFLRDNKYNHIVYEEWLMKKEKVLNNYLDMIYNIVKQEYYSKRKDSQKCLVFAASIEMCTKIRDYLRARMPELTIGKYTGEDEFATLLTNDISVTTIGSAGTAVDIPDLIMVLMTTAVSEVKANLQTLGRLRELKNYPGETPHFLYLTCTDIGKHRDYHKAKLELFAPRVLRHDVLPYGKII